MDVYVSVDMEGVAGIATGDQVTRGGHGYARAQELMTSETNAAIAGAFDAGATSVTVNDSHGTMDNLIQERLDPRARLILGAPKAQCMAHGLNPDFDLALFVGYHAAAGGPGVLSHTYSSFFSDFRLNGKSVSEAEVNALYAASQGVPVGLVTGDDVICGVAEAALPGVTSVRVKRAEGWTAANSMHPTPAAAAIRLGAEQAVRSVDKLTPLTLPDRLIVDVEMQIPTAAEVAALVPGAVQTGAFGVRCEVDSPADILGLVTLWFTVAAAEMRGRMLLLSR